MKPNGQLLTGWLRVSSSGNLQEGAHEGSGSRLGLPSPAPLTPSELSNPLLHLSVDASSLDISAAPPSRPYSNSTSSSARSSSSTRSASPPSPENEFASQPYAGPADSSAHETSQDIDNLATSGRHLPAEILLIILYSLLRDAPANEWPALLANTAQVNRDWRAASIDIIKRLTPANTSRTGAIVLSHLITNQIPEIRMRRHLDTNAFPPGSQKYIFTLTYAPTVSCINPKLSLDSLALVVKIAATLRKKIKGHKLDIIPGDLFDLPLYVAREDSEKLRKLQIIIDEPTFSCRLYYLRSIIKEWRTMVAEPERMIAFILTTLVACLNSEQPEDSYPKKVKETIIASTIQTEADISSGSSTPTSVSPPKSSPLPSPRALLPIRRFSLTAPA